MIDWKDAAQLVHFRELHFLPRVIFSIGTICFIASFFLKLFILGFFGVGIIFVGATFNLFINILMSIDWSPDKKQIISWMLLWQFVLSLGMTCVLLALAYHYYRYGKMPPYLEPVSSPVNVHI